MEYKYRTFTPKYLIDAMDKPPSERQKARAYDGAFHTWGITPASISIDGVRYRKLYHPLDGIRKLYIQLQLAGYVIPTHLGNYVAIAKWTKRNVRTLSTVSVPHLQAVRQWSYIYSGRHGFKGLTAPNMHKLGRHFFKEVKAAQ